MTIKTGMRPVSTDSRILRWTVCVLAALTITPRHVLAHEVGTTRVTLVLKDDRAYAIDVMTDAIALLEKLESVAAAREIPIDPTGDLQTRLATLDGVFRDRVVVRFDGAVIKPATITYAVATEDAAGTVATAHVRLSGQVPSGARAFTWQYGWTFTSYELAVDTDGAPAATTQALDGNAESAPVALQIRSSFRAWKGVALTSLALAMVGVLRRKRGLSPI